MRLIHVTDPHLSSLDDEKFSSLSGKRRSGYLSWRKNRRKQYLPSVLDKLSGAVRAEKPDQVLCTGDLVHIGLATEIAQATEWLTSFAPAEQLMLVPGNHDIYAKGSADAVVEAWSDYMLQANQPSHSEQAAGEFPVVRKLGKLSLIGLSTGCVTPLFMASGTLGGKQLLKLDNLLRKAAAEEQMVVLLIHHPPLPGMTNWRKALTDASALDSILKKYPPLLVFYGHLHYNREHLWGDSRIFCTAAASSISDASYRVVDAQDGNDHWDFKIKLKSLSIKTNGNLEFVTIDEQAWQVAKK